MSGSAFDLAAARAAAEGGEASLEAWVDAYLRGPGDNVAFADGLAREPRRWRGPVLLPLTRMERVCGPEPGLRYPMPEAPWRQTVGTLARGFERLDAFPPVILQYDEGAMLLSDGNHRHACFSLLGLEACWAIVWYAHPEQYAHHAARGFG